jgi:hypothetical protein
MQCDMLAYSHTLCLFACVVCFVQYVTGILQTCLRVGCDTHNECSAVSTQAMAVIEQVLPVLAVSLQFFYLIGYTYVMIH